MNGVTQQDAGDGERCGQVCARRATQAGGWRETALSCAAPGRDAHRGDAVTIKRAAPRKQFRRESSSKARLSTRGVSRTRDGTFAARSRPLSARILARGASSLARTFVVLVAGGIWCAPFRVNVCLATRPKARPSPTARPNCRRSSAAPRSSPSRWSRCWSSCVVAVLYLARALLPADHDGLHRRHHAVAGGKPARTLPDPARARRRADRDRGRRAGSPSWSG